MVKRLGLALVLALAVSVGAAWAADVEGKIQQIDPADRAIVLEDGTRLWLAEGLQMEGLKEGAMVKASYQERDGKKVVTQFQVAD